SKVAGDSADYHSDHRRDDDADDSDRQRDLRPEKNSREYVLARLIRAKQIKMRGFVDAEQMNVRLNDPQDAVTVATIEEPDRIPDCVVAICCELRIDRDACVYKRPRQPALLGAKVNSCEHRRMKRKIVPRRVVAVGRNKTGDDCQTIQQGKSVQ